MTVFKFPDTDDKEIIKHQILATVPKNPISNQKIALKSINKILPSKITTYLEDTITFLSNNNYIPELPDKITIVYLYTTLQEKLTVQFKKALNKPLPFFYKYPACVNLSNNTMYISNYFTEDNPKDKSIVNLNEQYKNSKLSLEHAFLHELGHLFLIEKNKLKTVKTITTPLLETIKISVEEGFAESFALHMMCLKYPNILKDTTNFDIFHTTDITHCDNISRMYYKKHYEYENTSTKQIEAMFDVYEFPKIYKSVPFKDPHGNLITNMNDIFEKAYDLSLENNKAVIKSKLDYGFRKELLEEFQKITHNPKEDLNIQINSIQNIIKKKGFNNSAIHSVRKSLNYNSNNVKLRI